MQQIINKKELDSCKNNLNKNNLNKNNLNKNNLNKNKNSTKLLTQKIRAKTNPKIIKYSIKYNKTKRESTKR